MSSKPAYLFLFAISLFFAFRYFVGDVIALSVPERFELRRRNAVVRETLRRRDVWSPQIVYPNAGTVWHVGDTVNVTWCPAMPPKEITNSQGTIALRDSGGFVQGPGGLGEPLASGFSLFDGHAIVEVPDVPAGTDYQIVLFGDSGNASPDFTISGSIVSPNSPSS